MPLAPPPFFEKVRNWHWLENIFCDEEFRVENSGLRKGIDISYERLSEMKKSELIIGIIIG